MATIETRQTPDGKTSYRVKIRIRGFPSQSATFERKTDARNWASQTETAMREGRYFKTTQAKKYTVADLIKRYLDYQKTRNPKRADAVDMYLDWWKSEIGAYALADVTKTLIIEKRDKLIATGKNVERRSAGTANRYMGALSHAFSVAVNEWEWLQEHPMAKIAKLPEPRGRVRFLSDDEHTRLLAACTAINSEFIYPLVVLALSTGARHGELINLQWKDVDFKRKAIVLQDTKNGERRVLPLAHHALELMQAQHEGRNKVSPLVFPSPQNPTRPWESRAAWLAVPNPYALMELAMMKMLYDSPEDLLEFCYPLIEPAAELAGNHSDDYVAALQGVREVTPRRSQLIRERCRTIAELLWAQNPSYRIKDIVEHEYMQRHSHAKPYDNRTIHLWVADLDPRSPEEKMTPFKKKKNA